ncbi:uncharacterized protein EI90DRAFT_1651328 [Cantharellus anzutake]|uniref:uncharacterized protein n=1 Tax=Cantharellus anzutake TaxID=1750568 RepID=UPI001908E529|nr:uncharacterized protein EI90DRAFT_1651328 [Cantharellus anzutake]KAF8327962.1 hypothetical protein EI90DRAFT_1651328 [Cantharellus anzutake]
MDYACCEIFALCSLSGIHSLHFVGARGLMHRTRAKFAGQAITLPKAPDAGGVGTASTHFVEVSPVFHHPEYVQIMPRSDPLSASCSAIGRVSGRSPNSYHFLGQELCMKSRNPLFLFMLKILRVHRYACAGLVFIHQKGGGDSWPDGVRARICFPLPMFGLRASR